MGAGQNKDGFIDMIVQTGKPFYTAGQFVDGIIHINCKSSRNYRALQIKLQGVQHVSWSEGSGKHRRHYSNTKKTYTGAFDIAIFANGIIPSGQYSFPFRFLLSGQFAGSMYESESCYIRYPMSAELISSQGKETQIFTKYLNILEPLRAPFGLIQRQLTLEPQCCGCCKSYGAVKLGISCDKNFIRTGDQIQVSGYIDNSTGKDSISNLRVSFLENRWKISSGGAIRNNNTNSASLYKHQGIIQAGQRQEFSFNAIVPDGFVYNTAIGSILSKYFILALQGEMGCCTSNPRLELPLVFHTGTFKIQLSAKIPPPSIWMPVSANEVLCTSMPVFHYQPNPSIPHLNRLNAVNVTNVNNLTQMNTMQNMNYANNTTYPVNQNYPNNNTYASNKGMQAKYTSYH